MKNREVTHPLAGDGGGSLLEINNVPAQLILYAVEQWQSCNKYVRKGGVGHNTNTFIKGISVWLILKSETTSGIIKDYRRQLVTLAAKCKMSTRTLDKYINWCSDECLADKDGKNLNIRSYKVLRQYGINITKREETIYYDTTNKNSLAEIIVALALQKMKENWMDVYWKKLNQNPDEYKRLYDLLVFCKADASRLHDPEYFRDQHMELMVRAYIEEKPGQPIYDFIHKQIKANPDLNCKAATYARKMGYAFTEKQNPVTKKDESTSMSFTHLKRRLAKKGLITVKKDNVESECRSRKDEAIYHHRWLKKSASTMWFRVDQIFINAEVFFGQKFTRKMVA